MKNKNQLNWQSDMEICKSSVLLCAKNTEHHHAACLCSTWQMTAG